MTQGSLEDSPFYKEPAEYDMPNVYLDEFIETLLRQSPAPRSASLATLSLIHWITEGGSCCLASSSAHHLFAATYIVLVQKLWEVYGPQLGESLTVVAAGFIDKRELVQAKAEVSGFLKALSSCEWNIIKTLVQSDQVIDELFELEIVQGDVHGEDEVEWMDGMEEELLASGRLVFDREHFDDYQVIRDHDMVDDSRHAVTTIIRGKRTNPEDIQNVNDIEISPSIIRLFENNVMPPI
ncbi:hypothetical protein ONZ45_g19280 [Pleurotus djamor]|nr:hypothetical protein ONZ45_g19280 [Pleurotus djamor]